MRFETKNLNKIFIQAQHIQHKITQKTTLKSLKSQRLWYKGTLLKQH